MNLTIIGIASIIIIAIIGVVMVCINKSATTLALYVAGLIFLAFGVYLLPASMWRSIAVGLLIIGASLEVIAIVVTRRKKLNKDNV